MSWSEVTIMSERREFVRLAVQPGANVSLLCRRFGISRKTGYKWIGRGRAQAQESFRDRSRRPRRSPWRVSAPGEKNVLEVREEHPTWGARKIRRHLENRGHLGLPAVSTITAILHRHGLIEEAQSIQRGPMQRFERQAPNELWQMDFKGPFATAQGTCHPLTIVDDHSRYAPCVAACADQQAATVQQALSAAFRLYGLPERMLMDNGACWKAHEAPYTKLTAWLIRMGVRLSHCRPYHPQTQGKNERFNRTLKQDVIVRGHFHDLRACQRAFDRFRHTYNHERPHEALDLDTPASRYRPSVFAFPEDLAPIEYPAGDIVRRVGPAGYLSFRGRRYQVGRAFSGDPVALRATSDDGVFAAYYCHQQVATLDVRTGQCITH